MSWNKNTVRSERVNTIVEVLKDLNEKYTLEVIGEVRGYGLNDDYSEDNRYKLRRLTYGNCVVIEQMIRSPDCDSDDVIIARVFKKEKAPKKIELEETIEDI